MALKAVGRVFNNVPKMVGGIGSATLGAGLDKKKANSAMLTRLKRKGLDKNGNTLGGSKPIAGVGGLPSAAGDSSNNDSNNIHKWDDTHFKNAKEAYKSGDMDKYQKEMELQNAVDEARREYSQKLAGSIISGSGSGSSKKQDKVDDFYKIMDKYDDELAKAKEKRRKGIQDAFSGGIETIGAAAGGMVGLSIGSVSGLATGDLDQIHKAAAYGIGVGDALGENLTNAVASATTSIKSRASVNKKLDNQIAQMEKNLKIQNNTRENQAKRVRNITQKIEKNNGISNI